MNAGPARRAAPRHRLVDAELGEKIAVRVVQLLPRARAVHHLHVLGVLRRGLGLDVVAELVPRRVLLVLLGAKVQKVCPRIHSKRPVDLRELLELPLLVLVVVLVHGHQELLDHLRRGVHLALGVPRDQHVHGLVVHRVVRLVRVGAAGLRGPAAANRDVGVGLLLHLLLRVPARADDEAEKVVPRVLRDRYEDLASFLRGLEVRGRGEPGANLNESLDELASLRRVLLLVDDVPGVGSHAVGVVDGLGRGRPGTLRPFVERETEQHAPVDLGQLLKLGDNLGARAGWRGLLAEEQRRELDLQAAGQRQRVVIVGRGVSSCCRTPVHDRRRLGLPSALASLPPRSVVGCGRPDRSGRGRGGVGSGGSRGGVRTGRSRRGSRDINLGPFGLWTPSRAPSGLPALDGRREVKVFRRHNGALGGEKAGLYLNATTK